MAYTAKERKALEAGFLALASSVRRQLGRQAHLPATDVSKVPELQLAQAAATIKTYLLYQNVKLWQSRGPYQLILKPGDREVSIYVPVLARNVLIDVNRITMIATKTDFNAETLAPSDWDVKFVQSRIVGQLKELLRSGLFLRDDRLVLMQSRREVYLDFLHMAHRILIDLERGHLATRSAGEVVDVVATAFRLR